MIIRPFSVSKSQYVLAIVGCRGCRGGCCGHTLVVVGLRQRRWPKLGVEGLHWPALAVMGLRVLAIVDLR